MQNRNKYKSAYLYSSYILITLVIISLNTIILIEDSDIGLVTLFISLGVTILSIFLFFKGKNKLYIDILYGTNDYRELNYDLIEQFDVPYAILDQEASVVWMNKKFRDFTHKDKRFSGYIEDLFPQFDSEILPDNGSTSFEIEKNEQNYRIEFTKIFSSKKAKIDINTFYYTICIYNETKLKSAMQQLTDQQPVVGMVYIDNYEELITDIEEVRRSLLMVLVETKINNYFKESGGIVRRLDKDKLIVFFQRWFLERIEAERFAILETVKSVNIGNSIPVTISMGIGTCDMNIAEANEYASVAMDLALSRGGDQCVVKSKNKIEYYGGNTQSVEKNTRVKARIKAQALREIMLSKEQVIIMGHRMTDVDSLGAGMGIYRAAVTLNKKAHIVINTVSTSIRALITPFIDNPTYPDDMFINSEKAMELLNDNTVVVVVDTNRPGYTECPELVEKCSTIVVFDHHRQSEDVIANALLSYIETYASSASEMVAEMLPYFPEEIKLRPAEADCIYAGIVIDTNNFTAKTGARTFEAAAFLKRSGADVIRVRKMFRDDIGAYKARAKAIGSAEVYGDRFAIAICPSENLESPNIVGAQAANELLDISGIKASFVITEFNDQVFISARSIDEVNVQIIMEKLGGGGHLNIAGAQLECSVQEAKNKLIETLDKMQEEGELN